MATLKFFIRTETKNGKMVSIRCRLRDGRDVSMFAKTGLKTMPGHWDKKNGLVKNIVDATYKDGVNSKLRKLKDHILDRYVNLTTPPDKDWLQEAIDNFYTPKKKNKEKTITLFSFIQDFIDKAPTRTTPKTGNPVCYKQIREYERTFYYLKGYVAERCCELNFQDITLDFYHDFIEYLQSEKTATNKSGEEVKEPGLAKNTIGKKVQTLKIFLNAASDQGINNNRQYKSHRFTSISEETESIYLNETELQAIYDLDLTENPKLDKVRDLFIVGCWTGLRYSDWDKVTPANIKDGFLELKQAKTGGAVVIPLHPTVEAVINKYGGQLPQVISNQKFNEYLKQVAREAELTEKVHKAITKGGVRISVAHEKCELVTTHTGRRSFATNLYKAGLPTLSIMQITGHRTEQSFLKYIKVTPREHAEKLKQFWQERVKLKVV